MMAGDDDEWLDVVEDRTPDQLAADGDTFLPPRGGPADAHGWIPFSVAWPVPGRTVFVCHPTAGLYVNRYRLSRIMDRRTRKFLSAYVDWVGWMPSEPPPTHWRPLLGLPVGYTAADVEKMGSGGWINPDALEVGILS